MIKLSMTAKNEKDLKRAVKDFGMSLTFQDAYEELTEISKQYPALKKRIQNYPKAVKKQLAEKHVHIMKGKNYIAVHQNADSNDEDPHEPVITLKLSKLSKH